MANLPRLELSAEAREIVQQLKRNSGASNTLSELFRLIDDDFSSKLRSCDSESLSVTQGQAILTRQLAQLFEDERN